LAYKKTIIKVFEAPIPSTKSYVDDLNRLNFLAKNYNLFVLTNQPKFIKRKVTKAKVIFIPYFNVPLVSSYLFWFMCGIRLLFIKYDLLIVRQIGSPISLFNFRKPFLCIVAIHPYQAVGLENEGIKLPFRRKIHLKIVLECVKRANYHLTISEQLKSFLIKQGVNPKKIKYLPMGVDMDIFNPHKNHLSNDIHFPKDTFIVIHTGAIGELRGLNVMLKGMRNIVKLYKDIILILIGCEPNDMIKIAKKGKGIGYRRGILIFKWNL